MKKLSSLKRLNIALAVIFILLLCSFINAGYISHAGAQAAPVLVSETSVTALDTKKANAKAELGAISVPNTNIVDWSGVYYMIDFYKNEIDEAKTIADVDATLNTAIFNINSLLDLQKYKASVLTSDKLNPSSEYLPQEYASVKSHYQNLIKEAESIVDINGYIKEAQDKYDAINEFEKARNAALATISNKQPEPAALVSYIKLIANIKSEYKSKIESIAGDRPDPSDDIDVFETKYKALKPAITEIEQAFETAFEALNTKLLAHNTLIESAVSSERAEEILRVIFTRATIQPYSISVSVEGLLEELGYSESVAQRAVVIFNGHIAALNSLREEVDSEAKLANGESDIGALETTLKTKLEQLKETALSEEDNEAFDRSEAERIDNLIRGLSKNSSWDEINTVRMSYENLTPTQRGYVTELEKLKELEQLKEEESPLIMWGITLIIVTVLFLALLSVFMFVVIKRKKNARNN